MIRKKIIRRVVRSDGIIQAERPEGKAFSADDWLVGVPVAGCLTGLGLHGIVFQKIFVSHSTRSPGPGAKGDGSSLFWTDCSSHRYHLRPCRSVYVYKSCFCR